MRARWPPVLVAGGSLVAALAAGAIYLPVRLFVDAEARRREHHGVFTVERCRYRGRANDTADCLGSFRSDDGRLQAHAVSAWFVGAHQDHVRRGSAPGTLAGSADSTVSLDENVPRELGVMLTLELALLAWLAAQTFWLVRAVRRHRRAAPSGSR